MKREIVPTSPQATPELGTPRRQSNWWGITFILFSICAGGLAGMLVSTTVLTHPWFSTPGQDIVIDASGAHSVQQIVDASAPALRERMISIIGTDSSLHALGMIVTADGWVVTTQDVSADERVVNARRESLEILERIYDPYTNLYILKLKQSELSVVTWATAGEFDVGSLAVVMQLSPVLGDWAAGRTIASVNGFAQMEKTTQSFTDFLKLDQEVNVVDGTPIVHASGKILGLLVANQRAIPGYVIDDMVNQYIEHESFRTLPFELTGRLLSFTPEVGAHGFEVLSSTAPEIHVGDQITSIEGIELTKQDHIIDLFRAYPEGRQIQLEVVRQGKILNIEVGV